MKITAGTDTEYSNLKGMVIRQLKGRCYKRGNILEKIFVVIGVVSTVSLGISLI